MVNEDRIRLMTRMAAYEQEGYEKHKKIVGLFRSDYISVQMLKSAVFTTIAFCILISLYIAYDFEVFMKKIYELDLFGVARNLFVMYVVMIVFFSVITYAVALYHYNRAVYSTKLFYINLKKLSRFYNEEE